VDRLRPSLWATKRAPSQVAGSEPRLSRRVERGPSQPIPFPHWAHGPECWSLGYSGPSAQDKGWASWSTLGARSPFHTGSQHMGNSPLASEIITMTSARAILTRFVPAQLKDRIFSWRERYIFEELRFLPVAGSGVDDGMPWVRIEGGMKFFGPFPTLRQRRFFRLNRSRLSPKLTEDAIAVLAEVVSRYLAPRSLPGQLASREAQYRPLRDPLNDFHLSDSQRSALVSRFLPGPGDVFLDIGAYLGYGTLRIAELVGPEGKVVAVESDPDSLDVLRRNVHANDMTDRITIIPKAMSREVGEMRLFRSGGTASSLRFDVLEDVVGRPADGEVVVQVDTADRVLAGLGLNEVDFINITVNGAEPDVLAGMGRTLANSPRARVTLAGWYRRDGVQIADLVRPQLTDHGFTVMTGRLGRVLAWGDAATRSASPFVPGRVEGVET